MAWRERPFDRLRAGFRRELWLPRLRRLGVGKAACEPLARGLTNAIELCSMAGRFGEGCLQDQPEPWAPPPNLPLPSQGEAPTLRPATPAPPLRRVLYPDPFCRELVSDGVAPADAAAIFSCRHTVHQRLAGGCLVPVCTAPPHCT